MSDEQQDKKPHYGEPSGQDPDMGTGGDAKPDSPEQAKRAEEGAEEARKASAEAKDETAEPGWTPTQA